MAVLGAATVLAALLIPVSAGPAAACVESSEPGEVFLKGFTRGSDIATPSNFFMVGENEIEAGESQPDADVTIAVEMSACRTGGARARATYATQERDATSPEDYIHTSGQTPVMCDDHHHEQWCGEGAPPPSVKVEVPIVNDSLSETAVEAFLFKLTGGTSSTDPGGVGDPGEAPVYLVDDDGPQRFSFEPDSDGVGAMTYSRPEPHFIEIPVFRAGPAGTVTSVPYSIESIGASEATEGTDYIVPSSHQVDFGVGQRFSFIRLQVPQDYRVDPDKTIEITLGGNVVDPSPNVTTLALQDSGEIVRDTTPPVTKFHHPRDGLTYMNFWDSDRKSWQGDYRIREMHVYDQGGSDATAVQMALAKRTEDHRCSWFKQGAWHPGACDAPLWLSMKKFPDWPEERDLYHRAFPILKPTEGTWIKDYQAWSRAFDSAGNVESTFTKGRNFNTFRVAKKPR
jgi:hypothetical protein